MSAASALVSTLQIVSVYVLFIITLPFSLCFCIHTIREYERGIVFRYGNLRGDVLLPGLNLVMFIIDQLRIIDLRVNTFEIPEQEVTVLTRDAISITVSAVVYYHVYDPVMAVVNVYDFHKSTEYLAANTLRDVLSANDLSKLLTDRAAISKAMRIALDAVTNPWGININCLEIKELFFPEELQRAMASEAEATQLAKARVISAEGEHVASEALQRASMTTSDSPGALQLSYLQTLVQISAENNETVVFPMPFHLLNAFKGKLGY